MQFARSSWPSCPSARARGRLRAWPAWPTRGSARSCTACWSRALGALFGNVLVRGLGLDGAGARPRWPTILGAAARRAASHGPAPGGLLLQYLAAANVLFLVGFLFVSPDERAARRTSAGADALGDVSVPVPPGPGGGDRVRRAPAADAHAIRRHDQRRALPRLRPARRELHLVPQREQPAQPHRAGACPALVTGDVAARRARMPTDRRAARATCSSLMGTTVPVERYEPVTDLCPPGRLRAARGPAALARRSSDSLVVYGHRVLPASAAARTCPPIDDAWGNFGGHGGRRRRGRGGGRRRQHGRPVSRRPPRALARPRRRGAARPRPRPPASSSTGSPIDADPALPLHPHRHPPRAVVRHAVGHPPDAAHARAGCDDPTTPDYDWSGLIRYQRHSLQTGAGRRRPRRGARPPGGDRRSGTTRPWSSSPTTAPARSRPTSGATSPTNNVEEVFRVPFFLKAAGQAEGTVVDDIAMT